MDNRKDGAGGDFMRMAEEILEAVSEYRKKQEEALAALAAALEGCMAAQRSAGNVQEAQERERRKEEKEADRRRQKDAAEEKDRQETEEKTGQEREISKKQ